MWKVTVLFLAFAGLLLGEQTVLLEIYQDELLHPTELIDTTVLKLDFSLDTTCYVLFAIGGVHRIGTISLVLDGDTIRNSIRANSEPLTLPFDQSYAQLLDSGPHSLFVRWRNNTYTGSASCQYTRIQALIFLPDSSSGSVSETHEPKVPPSVTYSIVSSGPYVSAPGASMVVDASGRVVENVISDGKVCISNLAPGMYFARDGERTVVKIVKVD